MHLDRKGRIDRTGQLETSCLLYAETLCHERYNAVYPFFLGTEPEGYAHNVRYVGYGEYCGVKLIKVRLIIGGGDYKRLRARFYALISATHNAMPALGPSIGMPPGTLNVMS